MRTSRRPPAILLFSFLLLTVAPAWAQIDIRSMAPPKPRERVSLLAPPGSGNDLGSVSADWAEREVHLVTGGADERLLLSANETLDRFFQPVLTPEAEMSNEPDRAPASQDDWLRPHSVHMSRVGEIEIGFNGRAKISCDLAGGNGGSWNLSKPVSSDIDVRLHHENDVNSLHFRLNW